MQHTSGLLIVTPNSIHSVITTKSYKTIVLSFNAYIKHKVCCLSLYFYVRAASIEAF